MIPAWIDPESWAAFQEMRKKIKAPLTPYAEKLIIGELVRLKCAGEDPQRCLDQSIMNSWRDVFKLRDKELSSPAAQPIYKTPPAMTAEERAASERARVAAMAAIAEKRRA